MLVTNMDFINLFLGFAVAPKVAKSDTRGGHWSDDLETTFNRFLFIKNIGIDTYMTIFGEGKKSDLGYPGGW
jgi:hypothetical protein